MLARRRVPTPRDDYEAHARGDRRARRRARAEAGGTGTVGVGMPGAISPATGLIKNANSTWLNGRPLRAISRGASTGRCASRTTPTASRCPRRRTAPPPAPGGLRRDRRHRDRRRHRGRAAGCSTGPNAIAGEWGHNPLPWPRPEERPGPPCYCGQSGCIETFLSGPGLAATHAAARRPGLERPEIAARAAARRGRGRRRRSPATRSAWRARLATVINVLDPDVIVLGGGHVATSSALYEACRGCGGPGPSPTGSTRDSCAALHGDSSGVRGAAWLWGPVGAGSWLPQPRPGGDRRHRRPAVPARRAALPRLRARARRRDLDAIARRTADTVAWIGRPILPLRVAVGLLLALLAAGAWLLAATVLRVEVGPMRLTEIVLDLAETAVNDLVYAAIAIFFLWSFPERACSGVGCSTCLHQLRSTAHVIDMHQLTKDQSSSSPAGNAHPLEEHEAQHDPRPGRALPRLLLGGAVAHRQGRGPLHPGLRGPGRAAGRERGRGPHDRPRAQGLAEADDPLLDARGGRLPRRRRGSSSQRLSAQRKYGIAKTLRAAAAPKSNPEASCWAIRRPRSSRCRSRCRRRRGSLRRPPRDGTDPRT